MATASTRPSASFAFAAGGGRLRAAGSATARGIAKGGSSSSAKRPAMRLSMSTAAAPVAQRDRAFSLAVRTGASATAKRSTETCSPASLRRGLSAEATPSLVRIRSSRNAGSSPMTRFPGRWRGPGLARGPEAIASSGFDFASPASRRSRADAPPQTTCDWLQPESKLRASTRR